MSESVIQEFRNVKELVEDVLKNIIYTRNSDKLLIVEVLKKLGIRVVVNGDATMNLYNVDLRLMPSFETITRCRREIQNNDSNYLPTDPLVLLKRRIREEVIKEYYGVSSRYYVDYVQVAYEIK